MFNSKYIEEIKELKENLCICIEKNGLLNKEIDELKNERQHLINTISDITRANYTTPEDCKRGEYCRACEFGRPLPITRGYGVWQEIVVCGKAETCKNFVQKES